MRNTPNGPGSNFEAASARGRTATERRSVRGRDPQASIGTAARSDSTSIGPPASHAAAGQAQPVDGARLPVQPRSRLQSAEMRRRLPIDRHNRLAAPHPRTLSRAAG